MTTSIAKPEGDGNQFVATSPWTSMTTEAFKDSGAKILVLSYAEGWEPTDLDFVAELEECELSGIAVTSRAVPVDVSALMRLESLQYLKLAGEWRCRGGYDFRSHPHLKTAVIERPKGLGLFEHKGIRSLYAYAPALSSLSQLDEMESLVSLRIDQARKLENIESETVELRLRELRISGASSLTNIAALSLCQQMERVWLDTCKNIGDVPEFRHDLSLRQLGINNCGSISSIATIQRLLALEELLFVESTNVMDGQIGWLASLPKLQKVAFMNRKHYDTTIEELRGAIGR